MGQEITKSIGNRVIKIKIWFGLTRFRKDIKNSLFIFCENNIDIWFKVYFHFSMPVKMFDRKKHRR